MNQLPRRPVINRQHTAPPVLLAERLRVLMQETGETNASLAKAIHSSDAPVSRNRIGDLLNSKGEPPMWLITKLARHFRVSVGYFFEDDPDDELLTQLIAPQRSARIRQLRRILTLARQLPDRELDDLVIDVTRRVAYNRTYATVDLTTIDKIRPSTSSTESV